MEQQEPISAAGDAESGAAAAAAAAPADTSAVTAAAAAQKAAAAAQLGLSEEEYDALMAPNDRWSFRAVDDGARARIVQTARAIARTLASRLARAGPSH